MGSHQHIVVHAVEDLLQVHVHLDPAAFLHVALRFHDCVVSATTRPKAVTVLREARVEHRLQDLQQGLLDEAVDYGGDTKLSHLTVASRDQLLFHIEGWYAPESKYSRSAAQWALRCSGSSSHRHPVDAGATLVLPHSLQHGLRLLAREHQLQQSARS